MYHLEDCPYWKGSLFSIASDNTVEVTSDDGPCPGCSRARQNKFEIRWPYIMQAVGTETQDSDLRVINSTSNPYVLRIVPAQGSISFEVDHYVANLTNIQEATERRLPQWGFRVVHKRSVGWNEEGEYFAHAVKGGLGESDFFDFSQRDIYEQLDCHERGVHFTSHFVSFTESIVEALIRARSAYRRGGEDVEIHMFDLTTLKQPALIGHALALLKGYLVFRDKNLVHRAKLKGASVTEFLVWDVLELDACVVRYKDLVRAGITEIVPALRSSCRNTLLPGQDTKRNPRRPTPSEVRNQLCRVELTLKQAERDAEANKGNPLWSFRNNRVGRFPIHTPKVFKEFEDPRSPMGMHTMNKYLQVARCARKPKFVLPWLVALLSLSTSIYTRESMIDLLDDILAGNVAPIPDMH